MTAQHRLSTGKLLSYGGLAVPMSMLLLPVIIYLPPFYADNLGISLSTVGGIFFLARVWDGVTDPIIGALSDRISSPWGRRKPWIAVGSPLLMISTYFLCVPGASAGSIYLFVWLFAFYVAWTMVQIPYQSWGAELTLDYHERNKLVGVREGCFMLGIILAVGVPLLVLPAESDLASILETFSTSVIILIPLTAIVALLSVGDSTLVKAGHLKFKLVPAALRKNRPLLRIISAYFIYQVGSAAWDSLVVFIVSRHLGLPQGAFLALVLVQYLAAILFAPVAVRLANRIGKHRAICVGILVRPLAFGLIAFAVPGSFVYAAIAFAVIGIAGSPMLVLPTSIVADVIDYDTLKTGKRQTGTYMSVFNLATKVALASGVGIALPLVDLAGFDPAGHNDADTMFAVVAVGCGMPVTLALVAFAILWRFPIDARRHSVIQSWLARRQGREAVTSVEGRMAP